MSDAAPQLIRLPGQPRFIRATAGQVWQGERVGLELKPDNRVVLTYAEKLVALSQAEFAELEERLLEWHPDAAYRRRRIGIATRLAARRRHPALYAWLGETGVIR